MRSNHRLVCGVIPNSGQQRGTAGSWRRAAGRKNENLFAACRTLRAAS
jgi:hypothetical protein